MYRLSLFKSVVFTILIFVFLLFSILFLFYRAVQFDQNYPNPLPQALTEKSIRIEEDLGLESKCDLPPETGTCNAEFQKYYYNKDENKCESYIYGGCGAEVPFDTIKTCEDTCVRP